MLFFQSKAFLHAFNFTMNTPIDSSGTALRNKLNTCKSLQD